MKYQSQVYSAASGSIGGLTYSRNRGGLYTRTRTVPSNPATERQGIARENLATAVATWTNDLTLAQRQAWISYAQATPFVDALGNQIILSGQQMFIRTYTMRILGGIDPVLDGPTMSGLGNTPQLTGDPLVDASVGTIVATANAEGATVNDYMATKISRPTLASRTPAHEPTRFAGVTIGVVAPPNWTVNVDSPFALTAGQIVRVTLLILWADGRCSAEAFRDTIVQA